MNDVVLAVRFDLPFYLRLPTNGFFTWDPECATAAIYPRQNIGEVSFAKTSTLINPNQLLDSPSPPIEGPINHTVVMTSESKAFGKIPTLRINTASAGGYSELRAYTEVTIFIVIRAGRDPLSLESKDRAFQVLNHFIDIYRLITQDPYVHRIDQALDTYLVDYSIGAIPENLRSASAGDILSKTNDIHFPQAVGDRRHLQYHLNTLEDLFPGPILDEGRLDFFSALIPKQYSMPLHYELIFTAQLQLKRRNYHTAILDAETAFEAYVANLLLEVLISLGEFRDHILAEMDNPRKLGLLSQRLSRLDKVVNAYRQKLGCANVALFVNGAVHTEWKDHLYKLRNRVIHEGWRLASFELARRGIAACKAAIKELEDRFPGLANSIQIAPKVDHLQNTAGRLMY